MHDQVYQTCQVTDRKRKGCLGNCLLPHHCSKSRPYRVLLSTCMAAEDTGEREATPTRAIVRAHIISFNSKKVNLESRSSCHFTHFKGKEQWVSPADMTLGPFLILDLFRSFSPSIFSAIRCRSPVNSLENFSPGFRTICPLYKH